MGNLHYNMFKVLSLQNIKEKENRKEKMRQSTTISILCVTTKNNLEQFGKILQNCEKILFQYEITSNYGHHYICYTKFLENKVT